jgi:hypothetical protein
MSAAAAASVAVALSTVFAAGAATPAAAAAAGDDVGEEEDPITCDLCGENVDNSEFSEVGEDKHWTNIVCDGCMNNKKNRCWVCNTFCLDIDKCGCCGKPTCEKCLSQCEHEGVHEGRDSRVHKYTWANGETPMLTEMLMDLQDPKIACKACMATCAVCGADACFECRSNEACCFDTVWKYRASKQVPMQKDLSKLAVQYLR